MRPRDPFTSPRFGQIATFMLLPAADSPRGLDVAPNSIEATYAAITKRIDEVTEAGAAPVCVGGDYSITLGIL